MTQKQISKLFHDFKQNVIIHPEQLHSLQIEQLLIQSCYKNNPNPKLLNKTNLISFKHKYAKQLKSASIKQISKSLDNLINDSERRFKGDFWTPTIWAKEADKTINQIIPNYKSKGLVWDCACGTGNLTSPFPKYKRLYCSTFFQSELDIGKASHKFNNATQIFQYDFLNDYNTKLPQKLVQDLKRCSRKHIPVIFYTNPPYGTASARNTKKSKSGIAKNRVHNIMQKYHFGWAMQQLYVQFIYRAYMIISDFHLNNAYIAFFTKPQFFAGGKYWKNFNHFLFGNFDFKKGFLLRANQFSGTQADWPVSFSILKYHPKALFNSSEYSLPVLSVSKKHHIVKVGSHTFRPVYYNALDDWTKASVKLDNRPTLGQMILSGNNVEAGVEGIWLETHDYYKGNFRRIPINKKTFKRVIITYTARKVVNHNWLNAKDNFSKPANKPKLLTKFMVNGLVYGLFSNSANQVSDKVMPNEWFWISAKTVKKVQAKYHLTTPVHNTFVYNFLRQHHNLLSNHAKDLLKDATTLWYQLLKYRKHDRYWDAGWYQMKKIINADHLKHQLPTLVKFKHDLQNLKSDLNNDVYKLNILKK